MGIVRICFKDNDSSGIREITVGNSNIVCYDTPRKCIKNLQDFDHTGKPAVYHLIDPSGQYLYIGETEVLRDRVLGHNNSQAKFEWSRFIAFTTSDEHFTKAHARYLEYYLAQWAERSGRIDIKSRQEKEKNLGVTEKEICEAHAKEIMTIMSIIGFNFYDPPEVGNIANILYCIGKDAEAKGVYQNDHSLLILKDSLIRKEIAPRSVQHSFVGEREERIKKGDIVEEGDVYRVVQDILLESPSKASSFVLGMHSSGLEKWKDKDGKTLREIYSIE